MSRTGYLFARPSAPRGAARVFDLWGAHDECNLSDSPDQDLAVALLQDWLTMEEDASAILGVTPTSRETRTSREDVAPGGPRRASEHHQRPARLISI